MSPNLNPTEVHQRLWTSACMIAAELEERVETRVQPTVAQETRFNGGVAPQVANHYAGILTSSELPENARILDLGCGFGRIAMALARRLGPDVAYTGLDPNADGIAWAQQNITPHYPNFRFRRIDVKSKPYNPDGTEDGARFRFPFDDASLDLVFMISVLTHVDLPTVETYLRETARVLTPSGRLVTTIFLLDTDVDQLLAAGRGHFALKYQNGESRVENPVNPELVIAHPRHRVLEIMDQAGFAKTVAVNGHWSGRPSAQPMDFQDLLIAGHDPETIIAPDGHSLLPAEAMTTEQVATYARIIALTGGDEARFSQFIRWSNALALNAFWWQCDGFRLCLQEAYPRSTGLSFEALHRLGLEKIRPNRCSARTAFHPLDDAAMIALLIRAGRISSRNILFDAFVEAAVNGLRVLDAINVGIAPVLNDADGGETAVEIPAWA
ncbi:class I SAM-dependent methyltransferase [Paracoccus sp. IB05]|uniref:class I SAM-dependent methyltransferase n=1 Tax=Paracoccus sp. IB05 TaxID=2779367 RepID=UPI0018E7433E|nr:class I SAM-dependent methyltransferase [Paracoccus sp. IB05]MBJ2153582.1 class I SAM-dependent methyltransferase [Paracoccus sp. IB05]